jgi:hypothetical protein
MSLEIELPKKLVALGETVEGRVRLHLKSPAKVIFTLVIFLEKRSNVTLTKKK